jgi:hypothetical protein
MAELTTDARRKYSIIATIANHNAPTLDDISAITSIPESSLKRHIAQIRSDYAMDIRFTTNGKAHARGRTGHYHILSWGILDQTEFLLRYGSILEE